MWWLLLLAPVLAGSVGAWGGLRYQSRRLRSWHNAVTACGLQVVGISSPAAWRLRLVARAGPLEVRIKEVSKGIPSSRVVVMVPGPPGFSAVRIRRELEAPPPWMREIEVGDESFDRTFFIEGPTRLVLALLDAETRRLLIRVNTDSRLEIAAGAVQAVMSDQKVAHLLPLLLDIGQRFARSMDEPRRLAKNVKRDPEAGVRLRNLLLLVRELPGDPVSVAALRSACSDRNPEIRLRAAKELGPEASETLLSLAKNMKDDVLSAQAVSALGRVLAPELARKILDQALQRRRPRTACACLEALGFSGAGAVETLARVLAQEKGETAVAAARALAATESQTAEPPLILALQHGEVDLRIAAATALGSFGSAAAVLPLKETAERHRLDRDLRRATRQAIAEIHSRLQGASPGQLSLAGDEAGQLSLAPAQAGQLSFAPDTTGQLSLPAEEAGRLSLSGGEERQKPAPRGAA